MYGFVFVQAGGANGGYMLKSNDPNADHPSGSEDQDGLCPDVCVLALVDFDGEYDNMGSKYGIDGSTMGLWDSKNGLTTMGYLNGFSWCV